MLFHASWKLRGDVLMLRRTLVYKVPYQLNLLDIALGQEVLNNMALLDIIALVKLVSGKGKQFTFVKYIKGSIEHRRIEQGCRILRNMNIFLIISNNERVII